MFDLSLKYVIKPLFENTAFSLVELALPKATTRIPNEIGFKSQK